MSGQTRIELLGRFTVSVDGTPIPEGSWRLRKSRSVIKVLALAPGRAVHPERMQELLWPDRDPASASNNLRQAVYHARRALGCVGADGAAILRSSGDLLTLDPEAELDVDEFESAAADAEASGEVADLEAAVAMYGGELLPEDVYEDWVIGRRRSLAERHVHLLLALAGARDPAAAVDVLHRTIVADPLNEEAHRALMRAYAATGRRSQALAQYESLRRTLADKLAADPEPSTRELYRRLLAEGAPEPATATAAADDGRPGEHNLPWQPTSFVGRLRELEQLERVLGARRLVTLTGPGGCGKTRLAFELAARRAGAYTGGAWAVQLAAIGDPGLVGQAAAHALGIDLSTREEPEPALASHIGDRELLLVLDNCEHLLASCARLTETLLRMCPNITILATSREPLHLAGEVDWRVPSLGLSGDPADLEELAASDAVRLFCDRASAASPHFALTADNARSVAELCFRLDGLPLAIELAAARISTLSPAQVVERLDEGLAVLRTTRAGGLTRQQTLQGTLDWSHDLLDDAERVLFRRLATFAGGFQLEAAEAICSDDELATADILDVLTGLVEKSLVAVDDTEESYRYRLLEPVRQYGAGRLRAAGESATFSERHARWFAGITERPGSRVTDAEPHAVDRLNADQDNLRAALAWMLANDPETALEMAAGMAGLWLLRGHLREGSTWLDRVLDAAPDPTLARCDALHARQALERRRPENYDYADRLATERVGIHHLRGDVRGEALALLDLTDGHLLRGSFAAADGMPERVRELATELGEPGLAAAACERTGIATAWRSDYDHALPRFEQAMQLCEAAPLDAPPASAVVSLACFLADARSPASYPIVRFEETGLHFRRLPPSAARACVLSHRAYVERAQGRFDEARTTLTSALEIAQAAKAELDVVRLTAQRGCVEATAGDLDAAETWLQRSLAERRRLGEHRGILLTLANLAVVAASRNEPERASARLDAAQRMANEAVDGPGMGAVDLARAEVARSMGQPAASRAALEHAVEVFYGLAGLAIQVGWLRVQQAYLSLELDELGAAERQVEAARTLFDTGQITLGIEYCCAIEERIRAANAALA